MQSIGNCGFNIKSEKIQGLWIHVSNPITKIAYESTQTILEKPVSFQVYKGYVDDPRNTDNAWMETVAVNFHDEAGNFLLHFSRNPPITTGAHSSSKYSCDCRQQCERAASAGWRWRRTGPVGGRGLVVQPLCEPLPLLGAGCQRAEGPLVIRRQKAALTLRWGKAEPEELSSIQHAWPLMGVIPLIH